MKLKVGSNGVLIVCAITFVCTSPALAAPPADVIAKIESLGGTVRWLSTASNGMEVDFQRSEEHTSELQSPC